MPGLLVSVRSVEEARAALAGGADLIDIKEPTRGSLGRAEDAVIASIVTEVACRRPVSAAMGEWIEQPDAGECSGLSYIKWGLAGCGRDRTWRRVLADRLQNTASPNTVLAAYADWQCALAPPIDEVFQLAAVHPDSVLLLDTYCKSALRGKPRPTLLDWLPIDWVEDFCARAREARVKIALAGSLGRAEIEALLPARPSWFAVRGAVCAGREREGTVQIEKVRELKALLGSVRLTTAHAS